MYTLVAVVNGTITNEAQASQFPQFDLQNDLLSTEENSTSMGDLLHQLLVSQNIQKEVLWLAHVVPFIVPWAEI